MSEYGIDLSEIKEPGPAVAALGDEVFEMDMELEGALKNSDALMADEAASPCGHKAVLQARAQIGVAESGGEDRGVPHQRYVRYFGRGLPPLPWCAFFVSWAFAQAACRPPWQNPGSVGSINAWARARGKLVRRPQHGDIWGLSDNHTGLVAGANPTTGIIYTVEGNSSDRVLARVIHYGPAGLWFARM